MPGPPATGAVPAAPTGGVPAAPVGGTTPPAAPAAPPIQYVPPGPVKPPVPVVPPAPVVPPVTGGGVTPASGGNGFGPRPSVNVMVSASPTCPPALAAVYGVP